MEELKVISLEDERLDLPEVEEVLTTGVEPPVEPDCCEECPTCNEYTVEPCEHKIAQ